MPRTLPLLCVFVSCLFTKQTFFLVYSFSSFCDDAILRLWIGVFCVVFMKNIVISSSMSRLMFGGTKYMLAITEHILYKQFDIKLYQKMYHNKFIVKCCPKIFNSYTSAQYMYVVCRIVCKYSYISRFLSFFFGKFHNKFLSFLWYFIQKNVNYFLE